MRRWSCIHGSVDTTLTIDAAIDLAIDAVIDLGRWVDATAAIDAVINLGRLMPMRCVAEVTSVDR